MQNSELTSLFWKGNIITSYFTFGQIHTHSVNGITFDKDCIVKITADDPRLVMHETFGDKWSMQYDEEDLPRIISYFPRGVIELV